MKKHKTKHSICIYLFIYVKKKNRSRDVQGPERGNVQASKKYIWHKNKGNKNIKAKKKYNKIVLNRYHWSYICIQVEEIIVFSMFWERT